MRRRNRINGKVRVAIQKGGYLIFILVAVIGASRIEQSSARAEHIRRIIEQFGLHGTVKVLAVLQPGLDDGRVFSEHAFSGAGSIHQNAVKKKRVLVL